MFYLRRVRRLFPAYLFDILAVLIVGQLVLIYTDYQLLKWDVWYAAFFASNVQAMIGTSGYFVMVGLLYLKNSIISNFLSDFSGESCKKFASKTQIVSSNHQF